MKLDRNDPDARKQALAAELDKGSLTEKLNGIEKLLDAVIAK